MAEKKPSSDPHAERKKIKDWRQPEDYGTGYSDNLEPLEPLDLSRCRSVNDLVSAMGKTSFGGREVGEAADVLEMMARDKKCFKVLTLSGAMTIAKMGLVVCDMIELGMVDAVVSTGALITHGFVETVGGRHFKYRFGTMDDVKLYHKGYNRVYDTLEPETNLDEVQRVFSQVLKSWNPDETACSWKLNRAIGEYLSTHVPGRAILKSAYEREIPVFVPAFTDSEMGLDFSLHNRALAKAGKQKLRYDPFEDVDHFADTMLSRERMGIFTIGGGVPRNWAQQVAPYLELLSTRLGIELPEVRFHYGVRICPEPAHWGGLSGCTFKEGVSWGKFVSMEDGGRFAEVLCDATIAWPLLLKGVSQRLERKAG